MSNVNQIMKSNSLEIFMQIYLNTFYDLFFVSQHFTKYTFVIKKKETEQHYTCMCQNLKKYYYIV